MVTTKLTTADELMAMPDDGHRYELIDGRLHRMAPTGFDHSWIGIEFGRHLGNHVMPRGLGLVVGADAGFFFGHDPDVVLAPDAAFVRADRLPPRSERIGFLDVIPDLVVEVVSPNDRQSEVDAKIARYLAAGVRLLWIAYPPTRRIAVHRPDEPATLLQEDDVLDGGDVVPGFRLPVRELFDPEM